MSKPLQRNLMSLHVVRDPRAMGKFHQKCAEAWGDCTRAEPLAKQHMKQEGMRTNVFHQEPLILRMNHMMPEELLPVEAIDHIVAFDYWNDHFDML